VSDCMLQRVSESPWTCRFYVIFFSFCCNFGLAIFATALAAVVHVRITLLLLLYIMFTWCVFIIRVRLILTKLNNLIVVNKKKDYDAEKKIPLTFVYSRL